MNTEEEILKAITHGDRKAMKALYDSYAGYATAVGLRYIPDRYLLKDVLQESFIKVFTNIRDFKYRGEGSLKAWITKIVTNEAINFLRDHGRFYVTDELPEEPTDEEPPDIDGISNEKLTELIGRLPDGYRTVLNLYVFEGLTHKEIAKRLNIKENSSASQYARARTMLARMIRKVMNTE